MARAFGASPVTLAREPYFSTSRWRRMDMLVACSILVLVGGLAIAKVGYDQYLRFVWPLWLALLAASTAIIGLAASSA